jgi:hypothetical protein
MIRLLFVGDGERDAATNPHLVEVITGADVDPTTVPWPRLARAGSGLDRKLLFALLMARDQDLQGLVATVDQDKSPGRDRLRSLERARVRDRETSPPLPTALGCADPHAEAWLLDDPVAVRTVLGLDPNVEIPTVRRVRSPKDELSRLHSRSPRADEPTRSILVEIAQALDPIRCQHSDETGFARFVDEVRDEIGPVVGES